jgi:hypothetical protein
MQHEEVIIGGVGFDVSTDNYDEFDHEIDPASLGKKLRQENPLKGSLREYQFYTDRHLLLHCVETKKARAKSYRVNLACLSPEPERNRLINWNWLYAALAAAALSGLCLFLAIQDIVEVQYCAIAGTVFLTASLILFLIFIYLMRDEYIFRSRFGNAPLFLIDNRKPEQQAFDHFFISLQQAIDKASSKLTVPERLIEELKMCRRLRDEGIIDDESYIIARTAIFKHQQYKN